MRGSVESVCLVQMYYDDLPIWGFIGKVEKILHPGDRTEYKYYLFTHIHFDILYNGKRVIEARSSAYNRGPFILLVDDPQCTRYTPLQPAQQIYARAADLLVARCCQHSCLIGVIVMLCAACVDCIILPVTCSMM